MAEQGVAQQHTGSDVTESSWTSDKKSSLRVLAAAEVRYQGEAVTGELKARKSRIPACHCSVLLSEQF